MFLFPEPEAMPEIIIIKLLIIALCFGIMFMAINLIFGMSFFQLIRVMVNEVLDNIHEFFKKRNAVNNPQLAAYPAQPNIKPYRGFQTDPDAPNARIFLSHRDEDVAKMIAKRLIKSNVKMTDKEFAACNYFLTKK